MEKNDEYKKKKNNIIICEKLVHNFKLNDIEV